MIFDHLLRFSDEATAQGDPVVRVYWNPPSDTGPGAWRGDVTIPGVLVYIITGTQAVTDLATGQTSQEAIRSYFAGWFIVIALPALDPALRDLPNNACRLIADRDAADARQANFLRYTAADVTAAELSSAHVEPTFAGSSYLFGV